MYIIYNIMHPMGAKVAESVVSSTIIHSSCLHTNYFLNSGGVPCARLVTVNHFHILQIPDYACLQLMNATVTYQQHPSCDLLESNLFHTFRISELYLRGRRVRGGGGWEGRGGEGKQMQSVYNVSPSLSMKPNRGTCHHHQMTMYLASLVGNLRGHSR